MLNKVMTVKEASEIWGIHQDTVTKACAGQKNYPPRLKKTECNKSGGTWLVTYKGMVRLFGEPPKEEEK